jgi:hypothetical protein
MVLLSEPSQAWDIPSPLIRMPGHEDLFKVEIGSAATVVVPELDLLQHSFAKVDGLEIESV